MNWSRSPKRRLLPLSPVERTDEDNPYNRFDLNLIAEATIGSATNTGSA